MRSSKKRSRSNQNRPRTLGNIVNRVFDSSGPEGKVRGTPQQIIEKYQMLARDAQLSNDRVAAENFLQHAEHYTRMLAEAQREMVAEQEARQAQYQQNGGGYGDRNGGQGNGQGSGQGGAQGGGQGGRDYRERDRDFRDREPRDRTDDRAFHDPGSEDQPAVEGIDFGTPEDAGLVETPEARRRDQPRPDRRDDRPRDDRPRPERPREDRPRDFRRDREDRRRDAPVSASAPEGAELPAFITGTPVAAPAPDLPPPAASEPEAKPRRAPRKPRVEGEGKKEAAE
jgi:Domain of unknown function (DUF4167)